jgi:hypothetical protein
MIVGVLLTITAVGFAAIVIFMHRQGTLVW